MVLYYSDVRDCGRGLYLLTLLKFGQDADSVGGALGGFWTMTSKEPVRNCKYTSEIHQTPGGAPADRLHADHPRIPSFGALIYKQVRGGWTSLSGESLLVSRRWCRLNVRGIMNNDEGSLERLDSEFDHCLVDMKPYVLKLPHKTERQRCALWIKKLCDPVSSGSGLMGKKNRNTYARLLLVMLKRGVLEGPFTHKPEPGSLKTLPTYMSIYFDEPLVARPRGQSSATLPDWVSGELGHADDTWSSLLKDPSSPLPNSHRSACLKLLAADHFRRRSNIQSKQEDFF
ncbi:hypothetical protein AOLI_G00165750 [Acnodon oligacanthus]